MAGKFMSARPTPAGARRGDAKMPTQEQMNQWGDDVAGFALGRLREMQDDEIKQLEERTILYNKAYRHGRKDAFEEMSLPDPKGV